MTVTQGASVLEQRSIEVFPLTVTLRPKKIFFLSGDNDVIGYEYTELQSGRLAHSVFYLSLSMIFRNIESEFGTQPQC
jgi:outer membrane protein assembly factor BamA